MDDTGTVLAFWILAVITVGSALMVAAVRNLFHAFIFLILCFMGVAGLYITLSADFVAVAQILIYAGAISILLLFALMLTPRDDQGKRGNTETFMRLPALSLAGLVAATIAFVAIDTDWSVASRGGFSETASVIGEALLNQYVLPFEIASAVLLAAMIGAILLVRSEGSVGEEE